MSPTRYLNDRSQRRVDRCRPVICELCGPLSHQATSINRGWVRFGQNSTTRAFVLRSRSIRRFTPFTCSYGGITRGSPCLGDSRFSILSSCEFPAKQPTGIAIESTKDPGMPVRGGRTAASALLTSAGRRSQAPGDESLSVTATPPSKLAISSSILSMLCLCRSRWPTHRRKLGKTLGAAPRRPLMATTRSANTIRQMAVGCVGGLGE